MKSWSRTCDLKIEYDGTCCETWLQKKFVLLDMGSATRFHDLNYSTIMQPPTLVN